jgi:N utilization substance protein B
MARESGGTARRSAARLAAVQTLYSMDITGIGAAQALAEFRLRQNEPADGMAPPDARLVAFLVEGATEREGDIDAVIAGSLSGDWSPDRLEAVVKAVLKAGAYEIMARPETPARVAISEYVDVARAFYDGPEPGMVNAVLDRVARALRPGEFS